MPSELEPRLHLAERILSAGARVVSAFRDPQLPVSQAQKISALPTATGGRFMKCEKSPFPLTSKEFNLS